MNKQIREKIIQDGQIRTAKEWAQKFNLASSCIYNATKDYPEVSPFLKKERIKPVARMPINEFLTTMDKVFQEKGQLTIIEWSKVLNLSPTQTRSIFSKHKLSKYQVKEHELGLQEIERKLLEVRGSLPADSLNQLSRTLNIARRTLTTHLEHLEKLIGGPLIRHEIQNRIELMEKNMGLFTLTEWSEKLDMSISALSHFVTRNNIKHLIKGLR